MAEPKTIATFLISHVLFITSVYINTKNISHNNGININQLLLIINQLLLINN